MISRDSFNLSRAQGFVESPAIERNAESQRNVLTVGIGTPSVYTDVRVRAIHGFPIQDLHTRVQSGEIALGVPGTFGQINLGGSGWARLILKVKGVACKILGSDYNAADLDQGLQPMGALMKIRGANLYSTTRINYTITRQYGDHGFSDVSGSLVGSNEILLNLFPDAEEYSDVPVVIDRIMAVSAQLPVSIDGVIPNDCWSNLLFGGGGLSSLYTGGTSSPLVTWTNNADLNSKLGNAISQTAVCKNPGLNATSPVPPYGNIFTTSENTVQLQVQLIGYRPDTGPRPEAYHDLAALT